MGNPIITFFCSVLDFNQILKEIFEQTTFAFIMTKNVKQQYTLLQSLFIFYTVKWSWPFCLQFELLRLQTV